VQYEFAPAWLLHGGARSTRYDETRVNQGLLMLEHYVGPFSWAAGWRPTRAFGTTAHNGELRASYYYGDAGSVGLILAAGREATSIGETVTLASMRSVALVGRHRLQRNWTLTYSAGHTRQGDFYTRNGLSLGIQYAF
jgi:YaiO family outer membrane protein